MATAKPLKELIQPYPYLAKALNHRWCERQEPDALGDSSHTLARWLRSPTANGLLTALDEALQLLDASPRIKQWRKSLADDREGIRGALFEIFLAAWFHKQGYSVGAPSKDADFTLPLRGGHSARLELTTIQRQTNLGMLTERLQAVGAGLNLAGHLSYEPSKLRNLTATNVDRIVEAEIEALTSPISEGARTRLEERSPQFGINLSWTPSHTPNIYSRSSAEWVDANQD
ncbi:MAG: hypothetical protein KDD69_19925, partial [Bdellovibrionales bacterium]|nr:hypothetical protein [Bdellovibrionales bacterium]